MSLGHWALREVCRQTKVWLDAGIAAPVTAVNVSAVQFKSPYELERDIALILAETGLAPERLELELTETVLMEAWRDYQDVLMRMCATGIRIAIDDFGTGYSSLDYLRRLPISLIKIAGSFVARIITSPGEAAIVKAMIGLAHELDLNLIAEGVETREQLELLEAWGCPNAQGFYFGQPLVAEEIAAVLGNARTLVPMLDGPA
jgi:EAL domain-containing protein (putative c-di-GMP-specific phosphodiesterase class I)